MNLKGREVYVDLILKLLGVILLAVLVRVVWHCCKAIEKNKVHPIVHCDQCGKENECEPILQNVELASLSVPICGLSCEGEGCDMCESSFCGIRYDAEREVLWISGLKPIDECHETTGDAPCFQNVPQYVVFWNFGDGTFLHTTYVFNSGTENMDCFVSVRHAYNGGISAFLDASPRISATVTTIYGPVSPPPRRFYGATEDEFACAPTKTGVDIEREIFKNRYGGTATFGINEFSCHRVTPEDSMVFAISIPDTVNDSIFRVIPPMIKSSVDPDLYEPAFSSKPKAYLFAGDQWVSEPIGYDPTTGIVTADFSSSIYTNRKTIILEYSTPRIIAEAEIDYPDLEYKVESISFPSGFSTDKTYPSAKSVDPNHLKVCPDCSVAALENQPLDYDVRFENLGDGEVTSSIIIEITFNNPSLIKLVDDFGNPLAFFHKGSSELGDGLIIDLDYKVSTVNTSDNTVQFIFSRIRGSRLLPPINQATPSTYFGTFNFTVLTSEEFERGDLIEANGKVIFDGGVSEVSFPFPALIRGEIEISELNVDKMKPSILLKSFLFLLGNCIILTPQAREVNSISDTIAKALELYYAHHLDSAIHLMESSSHLLDSASLEIEVSFWMNLGYLRYVSSQFKYAKYSYEQSLSLARKSESIFIKNIFYISHPLAIMYLQDGEYEKASFLLHEAILTLEARSPYSSNLALLYEAIAQAYRFRGKGADALEYLKRAYGLNEKKPSLQVANLLEISRIFKEQDKIFDALNYSAQAEKLISDEIAIRYQAAQKANKGDLQLKFNQQEEAKSSYKKAISLLKKSLGQPNSQPDWRLLTKIYLSLGHIALDQQNYLSAQQAYHRALSMRLDGVDSTDWNYLPLDTLPFADNVFIEALLGKARVFHRTGQLELALQAYRMAWRSLSDLLAELDLAESKSNLVEFAYPIYAEWMALLFEMNAASADASWHAAVFELMELSKAQQLRAWLATMDELKARKLPGEQIAREADLRQEWRRLEKSFLLSLQAFEAGEMPQDSVNHWAGQLYAAKDTHTAYLARILPEGTSMATDPGLPQLTEVQANMSPDAAILEYFLGEGKAFALLIKPQKTIAYSLPLDQAFTDQVKRFREKIFQVEQGPTMELGYALYRQLIAPLAKDLADVERLTIIPDGAMQGMPFEALVQSPQTPRHPDYLIKDYVISYGFSVAAHLNPPATDLSFEGGNCLAVSLHMPTESGQACAVLFPFVDKFSAQAEGIVAQLGGLALTGEQATAQHFVAEAPHYPILHIGSHGMVETAYPNLSYLAFFGPEDRTQICPSIGALYAADILAQNLNSELVFIEACEVAYQEKLVRPGEGVLGLARAFAYAGARSIVSTLWRVSPESGPQALSTLFYTYLQQGHPKDVALALTKRDLLSGDKRFAAPFYWAGFVAIGDMQPVTHLSKMPPWIGPMLIGLFLLILGILIWNRMATAPHSS